MTRQEMFDKAVRGLRSQGFERCVAADDNMPEGVTERCVYADGNGRHCAWGWIDTEIAPGMRGSIYGFQLDSIGVAAGLDADDLDWAERLQGVHDNAGSPTNMEQALREFAALWFLTFPED